jgi:hypothetical protein
MKTLHFFSLACLFSALSCVSSKSLLECVNARKGNTGNVGIIPAGEDYKPPVGKDYFTLELKTVKPCTIEIVQLIVKDYGGQVVLKPFFENFTSKMTLKAGETCYIRVEKEPNMTVAKPNIEKMGSLMLKVNGEMMVLPIEKFEEIIPQ